MCTVDTECSEHQLMLLKRQLPQACQGESSGGLGATGRWEGRAPQPDCTLDLAGLEGALDISIFFKFPR